MNLNHLEAIAVTQKLAFSLEERDFDAVDVAIIPPFTDIRSVQTLVDGDRLRLQYGAQDLSSETGGAFTGDISGGMLKKLGCTFAVVGHSERRTIHAESDQLVNKKLKAAFSADLIPILCIGEELSIRESGQHVQYVTDQMAAAISGIHKPELKRLVIAYEPVWAIGTGRTASAEDAQEVCLSIREKFTKLANEEIAQNCRILYGGSVKSMNIVDIMRMPDIDGALVGGASLDPEEFARICKFHRVMDKPDLRPTDRIKS